MDQIRQIINIMEGSEYGQFQGEDNENEVGFESPTFNELELKLGKRFIELVGGTERACKLIKKCEECEECLDYISDDEDQEIEIGAMANSMPEDMDLPYENISPMYDPSAIAGSM